jgi:hypothetical protein
LYKEENFEDVANEDGHILAVQYAMWLYEEDGLYDPTQKPPGFTGTRDKKRKGRKSNNGQRVACDGVIRLGAHAPQATIHMIVLQK